MQPDIDRFFQSYVDAFNRSLGEAVDAKGIRAHFADCFVGAGPQGVVCGKNDDSFSETLQKAYSFYKSIGTKRMNVLRVAVTPVDDQHHMAKVFYRADYQRNNGQPVEIHFDVTYLLHEKDGDLSVFAFIAGDEMEVFRRHGLLDD